MHSKWKNAVPALLGILLLSASLLAVVLEFDSPKPKKIPVLMYHSVSDTPVGEPSLSVTVSDFDAQMNYLVSNGYTPIDLDELGTCSQYGKPIIVTFDDGYGDNFYNAYPVLKKYNVKATIFMVSGYVNSGGFLTAEQIKEMEDLVSFQSHTVSHCRLDWLTPEKVDYECRESRKALSGITGKPVYAISYPNGGFNVNVLRIASKYYQYAVTTLAGKVSQNGNLHMLRRIGVVRGETLDEFEARIGN